MLFASGLGFSPSHEFELLSRPHLSRRRLLGAFIRAILLALAAVLASWIKPVGAKPLDFGLRYGLVVEQVGVLLGTLSALIEWYTDNLPKRRLGLLGICLIICGVLFNLFISTGFRRSTCLYGNTRSVAIRSLRTQALAA
jgi:hypothetical protein